jgi:hypothetical protein
VSKALFAVLDLDFLPHLLPMRALNEAMFERFTPQWRDRDAAMAANDAHNAAARFRPGRPAHRLATARRMWPDLLGRRHSHPRRSVSACEHVR